MVITITLTEEDLLRVQVLALDRDANEALAFVRERILPQVKDKQGKMMLSHLDGGKGSVI